VEFFSSSKEADLSEEQKSKLDKAKKLIAKSRKTLTEYNVHAASMFNQTADVKAQEKLIKWFALFCSFYRETVGDKTNDFEIFEGATLKEKEEFYNKILDEEFDQSDVDLNRKALIIGEAARTIGQVIAIWYNGLGSDQKEIKRQLDALEKEEELNEDIINSITDE
jgi:hypothetical protein